MDFNDSPAEAAFRAEARDWLAAHAPAHELAAGTKMPDTRSASRCAADHRRLHRSAKAITPRSGLFSAPLMRRSGPIWRRSGMGMTR